LGVGTNLALTSKQSVLTAPVKPLSFLVKVPMIAMIVVLSLSGSLDCDLDGGADDGRRSARTQRAIAQRWTANRPVFLVRARKPNTVRAGKKQDEAVVGR